MSAFHGKSSDVLKQELKKKQQEYEEARKSELAEELKNSEASETYRIKSLVELIRWMDRHNYSERKFSYNLESYYTGIESINSELGRKIASFCYGHAKLGEYPHEYHTKIADVDGTYWMVSYRISDGYNKRATFMIQKCPVIKLY